jgi:hypothetical protein
MVRRLAAGVLLGLAVLVPLSVLAESSAASPAGGPPCPAGPRRSRPVAFHFMPGVQQHRSWIEFPVSETDATAFTLCLDGRLWEAGIGQTPQGGVVRVSVTTSFVDIEWLLGRLGQFEAPERWELVYTTYAIENQR